MELLARTFGATPAALALALGIALVACGGARAPEASVPAPTSSEAALDAGNTADEPAEPPFAGSTAEATSLISAAVDKKQNEIAACVREFRARRGLAHERVAVQFGVDQEGRLLGVTSKGKEDAELKDCVKAVLKTASFPRSHAGVITVTKTYEEIVQ